MAYRAEGAEIEKAIANQTSDPATKKLETDNLSQRRCMVCTNLATSICDGCPLKLCDTCEVAILSTDCRLTAIPNLKSCIILLFG